MSSVPVQEVFESMITAGVNIKYDWIGKHIDPYAPEYKTEGSSGADLKADIKFPYVLLPGQHVLIPTGIRILLPKYLEAQVRSRSGLASKNGIFVLNSPGTIDSDYTGEICVILAYFANSGAGIPIFKIEPGMRIAQLVLAPRIQGFFKLEKFNDIETRGAGGFGSTGVK